MIDTKPSSNCQPNHKFHLTLCCRAWYTYHFEYIAKDDVVIYTQSNYNTDIIKINKLILLDKIKLSYIYIPMSNVSVSVNASKVIVMFIFLANEGIYQESNDSL
jgi:hypothetical protein